MQWAGKIVAHSIKLLEKSIYISWATFQKHAAHAVLFKCLISRMPSWFSYVAVIIFTERGVWDSSSAKVNALGGGIAKALPAVPAAGLPRGATRLGDLPCRGTLLLHAPSQGAHLCLPWVIFRRVYVGACLVAFVRNFSKIGCKWW